MAAETRGAEDGTQPLLAVRGLTLLYARRSALGTERTAVTALHDVSLEIFAGKTLALVGPSGSGKSSLARCLVLLERPSSGEILYRGKNLLALTQEELKRTRREIHLIFQDSASALNPGLTVEEILAEPLVIHESRASVAERRTRLREVMEQVALPEKWLKRRPLELSGGQRQRLAIARSITLRPKMLILDEAFSALDLSTQGQIANLLLDLQHCYSLAFLYITHNLTMASVFAHEVAVMSGGRIVRRGSPTGLLTSNLQAASGMLPADSPSRETVHAPLVLPGK
jgi:ABC-type glutathione transport system ATPase component